jgi:hypothetical protein
MMYTHTPAVLKIQTEVRAQTTSLYTLPPLCASGSAVVPGDCSPIEFASVGRSSQQAIQIAWPYVASIFGSTVYTPYDTFL